MEDHQASSWYRELLVRKAAVGEAPVIMEAPSHSADAVNNGPCYLLDVVVSGLEDDMYQGASLESFPFYHLGAADGRVITATWDEMRVDQGGQVERLNAYIARGITVTHQINQLMAADFRDPLDLLERGSDKITEAFHALTAA